MKNNGMKKDVSDPLPSGRDYVDPFLEWKAFVKDLREEWKSLWRTRIDDKVRAEGIASRDFLRLFVERGTVILATRDCKPPSFREILKYYMPEDFAERLNVNPNTGGWRKFIREFIKSQIKEGRERILKSQSKSKKNVNLQKKHGGRGWLHYTLK